MTLLTVPWDKMSGADFGRLALGITDESREKYRQGRRSACIEAIRIGDTYGFPPSLVDECRTIIAEREALAAKVESDLRFTIELQKQSRAA